MALIDLGDPGDPVVQPHSGVRRQFIEPGDVLADGGQLSRQLVGIDVFVGPPVGELHPLRRQNVAAAAGKERRFVWPPRKPEVGRDGGVRFQDAKVTAQAECIAKESAGPTREGRRRR